jgi:hypothetical protein
VGTLVHQLTKDPDQFLAQGTMTRFELSRKIWQKIMILDTLETSRRLT